VTVLLVRNCDAARSSSPWKPAEAHAAVGLLTFFSPPFLAGQRHTDEGSEHDSPISVNDDSCAVNKTNDRCAADESDRFQWRCVIDGVIDALSVIRPKAGLSLTSAVHRDGGVNVTPKSRAFRQTSRRPERGEMMSRRGGRHRRRHFGSTPFRFPSGDVHVTLSFTRVCEGRRVSDRRRQV